MTYSVLKVPLNLNQPTNPVALLLMYSYFVYLADLSLTCNLSVGMYNDSFISPVTHGPWVGENSPDPFPSQKWLGDLTKL